MNEPATVSYDTNTSLTEIAQRVREAERIAVFAHTKVDGDALGSMLALKRAIEPLEKQVDIFVSGPAEPNLLSLAGHTPYRRVEEDPPGNDYDIALVVDTGAWSQLEPVQEWLKRHYDRLIIIDHHARGDGDIAPSRHVNPHKASTCQLILKLCDELGVPLTGGQSSVAEALFIGIATDTGWFRYDNAQQEVFTDAARLLGAGVDKSRLYQIIEETQRPHRLALEAKALASLQYACGGTVAIMAIGPDDFKTTGASVEDLTGLVNAPLIVGDVRVSILLAQHEPNVTKISFRSKPAAPGVAEGFVDVNALAHNFGGGGHVHAAGARLKVNLDEARELVLEAVEAMPQ